MCECDGGASSCIRVNGLCVARREPELGVSSCEHRIVCIGVNVQANVCEHKDGKWI